jgi:hypothetical protein
LIAGADIEERVSALASEHLGDDSFNGRVFVDVCCRFVGWDNGRGLGVGARESCATLATSVRKLWRDWQARGSGKAVKALPQIAVIKTITRAPPDDKRSNELD